MKRGLQSLLNVTLIVFSVLGNGCRSTPPPTRSPAPRLDTHRLEIFRDGIIRGDASRKQIALAFTAHRFAEGGETILNELQKRRGRGSFFLTGTFVQNPTFQALIRRIAAEGHYLGLHSDRHPLYCAWEKNRPTLVSQEEFTADLRQNYERYQVLNLDSAVGRYFIPPYEHYNEQIVHWAAAAGYVLINYTPGTRSHADYTGEADTNFTSSQRIFDSILVREKTDPRGLNGFILLLHLGSGPGRTDKFHLRFGALLDELAARGYEFVRVDELLEPATNP